MRYSLEVTIIAFYENYLTYQLEMFLLNYYVAIIENPSIVCCG